MTSPWPNHPSLDRAERVLFHMAAAVLIATPRAPGRAALPTITRTCGVESKCGSSPDDADLRSSDQHSCCTGPGPGPGADNAVEYNLIGKQPRRVPNRGWISSPQLPQEGKSGGLVWRANCPLDTVPSSYRAKVRAAASRSSSSIHVIVIGLIAWHEPYCPSPGRGRP